MQNEVAAVQPKGLRWLHLTDLHVGSSNESQRTALGSLIEAIEATTAHLDFDLVILTGDLAYSGKTSEYALLEQMVVQPLRDLPQFANAKFVATPGNHDLDCDIGLPIVWGSIGPKRQGVFFDIDSSGKRTRESRASAFEAYSSFVRRCNVISVDPTTEPAALETLTFRGTPLAIISAVTAFFSDKDVSDYHKAPAPVPAIRALLQEVADDILVVVIGHHPISWFSTESSKHFKSLLIEKNALYLNGHEHEITSSFSGRGLLSIGFGAAYQSAQESPQTLFYRNSFAICELNEALHVKIISWDPEHGKWRLDPNLPGEFIDASDIFDGGFRLTLPTTRISSNPARPYASLASSLKANLELDRCVWLASDGTKRWCDILVQIGRLRNIQETYNLRTHTLAAGHQELRIKDKRGNYLVYTVSGAGDILTYDQLQAINTELDTQDYDGCIVATLGKLSDEAATLATRLKSRKAIVVLERDAILRDLVKQESLELRKAIGELSASEVIVSILVTDIGLALLRQDRISRAWFDVVDETGLLAPESSSLVVKLRLDMPELRTMKYRNFDDDQQEEELAPSLFSQSEFDRESYLHANYSYFDDVKYAPLAALGFRFRKASLSEIYVSASADVNGASKNTQTVSRAVGEFIESLNLPKSQRDQLESQMRSRLGIERTAEVGAARQLYQRYNNVVLLGDPGSGKTCFVKHEILAYCKPPVDGGSWYSSHLPIYVSLAEASRLSSECTSLLEICETVSARRGISLPKAEILKAMSLGQAAFFFDGLDEVGFIEKRVQLMAEIDQLINAQAHRGNRFVLASRPAAVQPVDIPEGLTFLHLKGLSESEMRTLAARVLTVRLGTDEEQSLTDEENELVERLLEDTRHSPGIARIARNPLLLTLLVLIYANTGAISAKRHLIYTQAIKTLVSVRGRDTREQQISEADLRTRLGALAVAIFNREIAEIPRRSEVLKVVSPHVHVDGSLSTRDATNAFLQEVAEATGLLSIHGEASSDTLDLITFMHYSFLEYYAAAGLLSRDYIGILPKIGSNPRWKDVITLLFGILSEQSDVSAAIEALLAAEDGIQEITQSRLLLCLDCAAECDVPPVATQHTLAKAFYNTMAYGVGRTSGKMREALADRIAYFLQGAATRFDSVIIDGLTSSDDLIAAAFVDFVARLPLDVELAEPVRQAFAGIFANSNPTVTASALFAVERRDSLRVEMARPTLARALRGSLVEKHAALKVLAAVPAYYDECSALVEKLLGDANDFISSGAAQCILASNTELDSLDPTSPIIEKLLTKLSLIDDDGELAVRGVTLDRQKIESMVVAGNANERELAVRYTPLVKDDSQFVYQTLIRALKSDTAPRIRAASLDSFRYSPRAVDLITIADTDFICGCLQADERNVRIAAIRLLAEMPDDEQVIRSLQDNLRALEADNAREIEIAETAKALSKHARRSGKLRSELLRLVATSLPQLDRNGFGNNASQHHLMALLAICQSLGSESDNSMAHKLLALGENYKTPEAVRKHAMRAFGQVCEVTPENTDHFVRLLRRSDIRMNDSIYASVLAFISKCKRKVESVRRIYSKLPGIRDALITSWKREAASNVDSIDPSGSRDIREAVLGIEELISQYGEFSERVTVADELTP